MFQFDDFEEEFDIEAIYNEGRSAFEKSSGGNPYNDNLRADIWAHGFQDASRKFAREAKGEG